MSYDLYFQITPTTSQKDGVFFAFGTQAAQAVQGPAKLLNRWLKCLMTRKSSDPSDSTYGTVFVDLFGSNITSLSDLSDAVGICIDDCSAQVFTQDLTNGAPANERLASATITEFTPVGRDGFSVVVLLQNAAGATFRLTLPTLTAR